MPTYDRHALTPGVVHISVGCFHRSHQAVYFDDLAELGHKDWGVVGVGLRRPEMREVLAQQDRLYTVVARGNHGDHARVIGAMSRYVYGPAENGGVLEALTDPRTALVTLTVTGNAYETEDVSQPGSALGYLVKALDRRRREGLPPFSVLSCDNLPQNGDLAREAVLRLARRHDERLAAWIEARGAFPNSMVDRITPQTTLAAQARVLREFGIEDRWPVITEPFSQWVVEDEFCGRRPPLEEVGVQMVPDVHPYALMKTRLLNATHSAIGYLGYLAGLRTTDGAMMDPVFGDYVVRLMEEVSPLLPPVPGVDLDSYKGILVERLGNHAIRDELSRLCRAGSGKVPAHVLSSIAEARERDRPHPLLTLAVAGWCRYLRGYDEDGRHIAVDDPVAGRLGELARRDGGDPRALLRESGLFGALGEDPDFADELRAALSALDRHGTRTAVAATLEDAASIAA